MISSSSTQENTNSWGLSQSKKKAPWVMGCIVTLFSFLVYLATLAPTITWRNDGMDGGDLISAAYTLGIPHPTGYPTYVLLARLFSFLPWGDVAYRVNLMSAVFASLTVLLVYAIVLHLQAPPEPASSAFRHGE